MKVFITVAFLCITTITTRAQQTMIKWSGDQQLTWDDFIGKVNDTSKYDAECFAEIRYNYKFYSPTEFEFDVFANFDKSSSWRRKEMQSDDLLRHEQMHFNIAALFAEKLKDEFESSNYSSDFDIQISQLFNEKKREYQAMQRQYDEETSHSLNKEKQKQWEDFISNELRKTKLKLQFVENSKKASKEGI